MPGEKRGVLTLRPSLFLTVILLLLLICIVPTSAIFPYQSANQIQNGSFERPGTFQAVAKAYSFTGNAATNGVDGIYFRKIEKYPNFRGLDLFSNTPYQIICNNAFTCANNVSNTEAVASIGGVTIGTGTIGYTRGSNTGEWFIFFSSMDWNIRDFTGPQEVILTYDTGKMDLQLTHYSTAAAALTNDEDIGFFADNQNRIFHTDKNYNIWYSDYWNNNWYLYRATPSSSYYQLYIEKDMGTHKYHSLAIINATIAGKQQTLLYNQSNIDENILIPPTAFPLYIQIRDFYGDVYLKNITIMAQDLSITIDKGSTTFDALQTDTTTTAKLWGSNGASDGIKFLTWEWSENWDEFFSSTSSMKIGTTYYRSFMYNSTNTTSGGNWELYGKGFSRKSDAPTSSTLLGSYTWAQIKSQSIQFNWTQYEPSWNGQAGGRISPYNYVSVRVSDDNAIDLAYIEKPVYVIKSVDTGQFQIWIRDYTWGTHIYDANLWIFDTTIGSWVYNKVNVTQSSYTTDVTIGHTYFIWAGKAGYQFIQGVEHPENIIQQPINGCVTYSALSASVKELSLILAGTAAANGTAIFRVETIGGIRISNAKITITSHQTSDIVYTDATGMVYFQTIRDLNYQYIVEHTGAGCLDKVIGEFPSSTDQYLSIIMEECTEIPTITPTLTPSPTSTLLPGPGEPGGDLISSFVRLFQMAGAGTVSNAKLMLALVVCSALAFIFGYYLSFQASLIGAFIGFVFSLAFGLIPMWILIALIIIGGVLFAGKWWSGSGGG